MKKSKRNPHLRLLAGNEYDLLKPDWETTTPEDPPAYLTAIGWQMNRLHFLCDLLFVAIILLELSLLQIGYLFDDSLTVAGILALVIAGIVLGVSGSLLLVALSTVETNVRRELEDADAYEEVEYVCSIL